MAMQRHQLPHMQQQLSYQHQRQDDDFIGPLPQPSVFQHQAEVEAEEQETVQLYSSSAFPHEPTAVPVLSLLCLLDQDAPAAAAAARALSSLVRHNPDTANYVLQQDTVLKAAAWWLQGSGPAAHAAVHLLLTLAGMRLDMHFEAAANSPASVQGIMQYSGILEGLVQQLTRGTSSVVAAAVLLMARYTAGSGGTRVAAQLSLNSAALSTVTALLVQKGPSINLADAAAQLLHTVAEAWPEAAQAVAETEQAVAKLLGLLLAQSKTAHHQTQPADAMATDAAWRAASALCSIVYYASPSMRWRVAKDDSLVAALVPALQLAGNQNLQDWALHILLAAASTGDAQVCSLIISFPGFGEGLLDMLPGGARPREAAQDLASALAASGDGAELPGCLLRSLASRQPAEGGTAMQQQSEAAAWQAVWVLTHLTSTTAEEGGSTLPAALQVLTALLPAAGSDSEQFSRFRQSLASKLGAVLGDEPSSAPEKLDAAAAALSALVQSVTAEERAQMATCAYVVCGLAHYLEWCYDHDGDASSCGHGVAAAEVAALKLLADAKPQRGALAAPARMQSSSMASRLTWLTANNDALQHMVAGSWGNLTVAELAAIAKVTAQAWAKHQQQQPAVKPEKGGRQQHPDVKHETDGKQQQPPLIKCDPDRQQQQQPAIKHDIDQQHQPAVRPTIDRRQTQQQLSVWQQKQQPHQPPAPAPACSRLAPPAAPPVPPSGARLACPQPPAAALLLAAAGVLQRPQQRGRAVDRKTPLPARPDAPAYRQPGQPIPTGAVAAGDKLPAGHTAARSHAAPPPAAKSLQQAQQAVAAALGGLKASAPGQPKYINEKRADHQGPSAAAARLLAAEAPTPSKALHSSAFASVDAATQQRIIEQSSCVKPDQHLAAWQVAVQPFNAQQLECLCSTYLRCTFVGESRQPAVRSQELVPLLQQLHTQAKAEQSAATMIQPAAAAAAAVQPTPSAVKLLHALQLLQHWDIVCPTQPGMPEPLRKMMQQAGCAAAAGSAADDGVDDVLVVDTEPAAQVGSDVEAQLQQLEHGLRELVLVKYVPGRQEQPDVQRPQADDQQQLAEPEAVVKQEATAAAACAGPTAVKQQAARQQQQARRPGMQAEQPASCRVQ